jgi:integrase
LAPAGLSEDITPKSFRTTVASELSALFGDEAAAAMLGHSSPETTRKHYIARPAITPDFGAGPKNLAPAVSDTAAAKRQGDA